jgi:hypothetical protein
MSEIPDYGTDLMEINRAIRRLAPCCGVDLDNMDGVGSLLSNTQLPSETIRDKTLVTLRGLMFLQWKILKDVQ